jgi:hypothetical protein
LSAAVQKAYPLTVLVLLFVLSCGRAGSAHWTSLAEIEPERVAWLRTAVQFDAYTAHSETLIAQLDDWPVAMATFRGLWDERDTFLATLDAATQVEAPDTNDERILRQAYKAANERLAALVVINDPTGSVSQEYLSVEILSGTTKAELTSNLRLAWQMQIRDATQAIKRILTQKGIEDNEIRRYQLALTESRQSPP